MNESSVPVMITCAKLAYSGRFATSGRLGGLGG